MPFDTWDRKDNDDGIFVVLHIISGERKLFLSSGVAFDSETKLELIFALASSRASSRPTSSVLALADESKRLYNTAALAVTWRYRFACSRIAKMHEDAGNGNVSTLLATEEISCWSMIVRLTQTDIKTDSGYEQAQP